MPDRLLQTAFSSFSFFFAPDRCAKERKGKEEAITRETPKHKPDRKGKEDKGLACLVVSSRDEASSVLCPVAHRLNCKLMVHLSLSLFEMKIKERKGKDRVYPEPDVGDTEDRIARQ